MQSRALRPPEQSGATARNIEGLRWQSPCQITIFTRCLRLLDLDTLPDWPKVTDDTFSSKQSQQNLQARVKGTEWCLYRLFEIYDAKETQLKLRPFFPPLAPLQSLNLRAALYRSLTELKKDGILGKEAVLRKTMLDECKGDKFEEAISTFAMVVLRKACRWKYPSLNLEQVDRIPKEQLLPLILAHRHSLSETLKKRDMVEHQGREYSARLDAEESALERRDDEVRGTFDPIDQQDLDLFSRQVRSSWIGHDSVLEILLGGQVMYQRPDLGDSFDTDRMGPLEKTDRGTSTALATELNDRIAKQELRLRRWKNFQLSLKMVKDAKDVKQTNNKSDHFTETHTTHIQFAQHKSLHLSSRQLPYNPETELKPYHQSLFDSMQDELAGLDTVKPIQFPGKSPLQEFCPPIETPTIMIESSAEEVLPEDDQVEARREKFLRRRDVAIEPAADQVQATGLYNESHTTLSDILAEEIPPNAQSEFDSRASTLVGRTRKSMAYLPTAKVDSDTGPPKTFTGEEDKTVVLPPLTPIEFRRDTLLERTRQSMSLFPNVPLKNRSGQLAGKQPRFSEVFPVSQFETPGRQKGGMEDSWSPRSGSSTPRDTLFSEDADYASVFKSRPRIAVSPALSPERSGIDFGRRLEEGMGDLSLGDDEEDSFQRSPIRAGR